MTYLTYRGITLVFSLETLKARRDYRMKYLKYGKTKPQTTNLEFCIQQNYPSEIKDTFPDTITTTQWGICHQYTCLERNAKRNTICKYLSLWVVFLSS